MSTSARPGWLLYRNEDIAKNRFFIEQLTSQLETHNLKVRLVPLESLNFRIDSAAIELPDFVINRSFSDGATEVLESLGIPCFNRSSISRIGNNKALTLALADRLGIPTMDSLVYYGPSGHLSPPLDGPVVTKAVGGHGGAQVSMTSSFNEELVCNATPEEPVLVQRFNRRGSTDHRCYIFATGARFWVQRSTTSPSEFRSNISLGGVANPYEPTKAEVLIADAMFESLGPGNYAVDLIECESGFALNEIEDSCGYRALYILELCDPAQLIASNLAERL